VIDADDLEDAAASEQANERRTGTVRSIVPAIRSAASRHATFASIHKYQLNHLVNPQAYQLNHLVKPQISIHKHINSTSRQSTSISIQPSRQSTSISIQPSPPSTSISIQPSRQSTSISIQPSRQSASISIQSSPQSTSISIQPSRRFNHRGAYESHSPLLNSSCPHRLLLKASNAGPIATATITAATRAPIHLITATRSMAHTGSATLVRLV